MRGKFINKKSVIWLSFASPENRKREKKTLHHFSGLLRLIPVRDLPPNSKPQIPFAFRVFDLTRALCGQISPELEWARDCSALSSPIIRRRIDEAAEKRELLCFLLWRKMKFYISTTGIKRLTISSASASKASPATRRISGRTVLPLVLVLALILPFLFVRIAFIVLESATACSSTLGNNKNSLSL